jgi:ferric-dicitrate binding protein FerR (iron transport regulator)
MNPEQLESLVEKYTNGSATPDEKELLNQWFRNEQVKEFSWDAEFADEEARIKAELLNNIRQRIKEKRPPSRLVKLSTILSAAAAVILVLGAAIYLMLPAPKPPAKQLTEALKNDALPGTNGAVLTLAGGQKIELGKSADVAAIQSDNRIKGVSDSTLVYHNVRERPGIAATYNTLTVPNGNQFSVVLPDGTKVWMNAGSSLYYPTRFEGSERHVKLTGEAYFEVVHNPEAPFKVEVRGQTITDLGTEFNINGYTDEPITTVTLVAGKVRVGNNVSSVLLQPGHKAEVNEKTNNIVVGEADLESAIAWKSGLFHFDHVKLDAALRQIARWYNLQVIYAGAIPDVFIDGEIYRDVKASQLFAILKQLNVHFTIEDNKLIVSGS